ncbi:MAG: peptidoglycan D,D-transpeptidase FtsI family protein [Armatimonadota bacterium]
MHRRIEIISALFALCAVALIIRLGYVQLVHHEYWRDWADSTHYRKILLHAPRGLILDRNGRQLAVNVPCGTVVVNPRQVPPDQRQRVAGALCKALGVPYDRVMRLLLLDRRYVYVKRRAPMETALEIEKMELPGITVERDTRRVYPAGKLASHVIGFANIDGVGMAGVERKKDDVLAAKPGEIVAVVDGLQKVIPGRTRIIREPRAGRNVILSIDSALQERAESELDKAVQATRARGGTCIVLDPHTGEVLALATSPRFDPNRPGDAQPEVRRNPAVELVYEPGSTMKMITSAAALDSGLVSPEDTFFCPANLVVGRHAIHCVVHHPYINGHGAVNIRNLIRLSCNIGAARVAMKIGQNCMLDYMRRFGLGSKTGVELPSESPGKLPGALHWRDITLANIGFGQGVAVTPMQLAAAYAAVANDGVLVQPTVLRRPDRKPIASKRVISPKTASVLREYLEGVVQSGTGQAAKVRGYRVAGKTGTAQKAAPARRISLPPDKPGGKPTYKWVSGGYMPGKFVASFVGFIPAGRPRVVILVAVDEPSTSHYGGVVAAPVFREVARAAMARLGVSPDDPSDAFDGAVRSTWPKTDAD